jgi:hypothetical protein
MPPNSTSPIKAWYLFISRRLKMSRMFSLPAGFHPCRNSLKDSPSLLLQAVAIDFNWHDLAYEALPLHDQKIADWSSSIVIESREKMEGGQARWRERALPLQSGYFRRWYYDVMRACGSLTVTRVP